MDMERLKQLDLILPGVEHLLQQCHKFRVRPFPSAIPGCPAISGCGIGPLLALFLAGLC